MGFRLSQRDPHILRAVNDCQALTVSQLITLFWNSPNPAYTRLRQLVQAGYLEKHFITQIRAAPAASPMVFTISKQGAAVLTEHFGYGREDFHFVSRQVKNWQSLQLLQATNDIRVALTRACWEDPAYELVEWRNELRFRSNPDFVYLEHKKVPVYPDGFCIVRRENARTLNFVEADSGSEGLPQVLQQLRIYMAYTQSGLYEQSFGTKFWRVLLVTNSLKRRDNIRKRLAALGGGANFWFTTFDELTVNSVLRQPIWVKTAGTERYSFFG